MSWAIELFGMAQKADPTVSELAREAVEAFGSHLRSLREARGLTQEELAEGAELSSRQVQRLEGGYYAPSLESLCKLALGLRVTLGELVPLYTRQT